jgi:hypothetical protein
MNRHLGSEEGIPDAPIEVANIQASFMPVIICASAASPGL